MAPKRAAKKPAPPPPPPPPVASSDEESDSRSRSEESDDEDAIAESPPPAPTPTPKNTPAPPQEGEEEEEESDEEEEEEEEESDEEPAHAAPAAAPAPKKNPPPPLQQRKGSDTSDEEEEDEEEPTKAAPRSAPKKQPPPPPQQKQESDASEEEEEEGESEEEAPPPKPMLALKQAPEEEEEDESEEEAPPPKPVLALKQAPEGLKPPAAAETKKPAAFSRIWSTDDEVRILEALAAHQKQHGTLPQPDALVDALAGKLDNRAYGSKELQSKVATLKRRYLALSKKGEVPSKEHDRRVLDLSKIVWGGGDMFTAAAASAKAAANDHTRKGFEEMCTLYPYLADQVKELDAASPGIFKRQFGMMDDDKARAMDEKIKKQRVAQMKVELRRHDLAREVTKAIIDLVD
ncbi:putative tyrosine-protein phosphatase [Hordeum vulgare]|nr:putative tyrosine-protein phosphatase [Hordeum vulgare]